MADHPLAWSVCLCAGELCLGLLLLSGVFRKAVAWGYGGGDVCLYRADGLAGFLACGDVGAGLRLFRRCFHVGARGYAVEKRVAVGFGGLAFVGSADGESWHGLKGWRTASCCAIFSLGSSPFTRRCGFPGGFPAFRPWGGPVRRAGLRSVRRTL